MGQFFSTPEPKKEPGIDFLTMFLYFYLAVFFFKKLQTYNPRTRKRISENLTLNDVIGLETVKEEIHHYMDFIKNSEKYQEWGVNVPRGILLAGPPGTGKTLLVKAIADSLDIPVISASGSEFVEMYVGVGAARIRTLFDNARQKESCIIFIDEIDAIGTRRNIDNNSERASTLNQLLIEMDGFDTSNNLIVFGATNLTTHLDHALLRSGRFDKKIYFDLPNVKERTKMFKLYLESSKTSNIDFLDLADRSTGLSGADISNISNQSKINAISRNSDFISNEDIQEALDEIMIGREKRERMLSPEERDRVAHHEAGHAIIGYLLQDINSPLKVSIIPRGEIALGFSQNKPDARLLHTKDYILSKIAVLLGGRCAELVIYDSLSTGASDDIEKVSKLAENYHTKWGMSTEFGAFNPNITGIDENDINKYCHDLIISVENFVLEILKNNEKYIKKLAKKLLNLETINYKIVRKTIGKNRENSIKINL